MTFEEFWKENYEKEFGTFEPYYGIASYAFEKGQENCNCVYTDNSNVIQKLEKENAKLKEKNKALELYADLADGKVDEVKGQLTRAKEIIKDYMIIVEGDHTTVCSVPEENRCINVLKLNEEAEQFLKEVEK